MKTRLTSVTYLGFTAMDRRFSCSMLPWLLREIRATAVKEKLSIAIEEGCLKAYNGNFEPVIIHRLVDIIRASQVPGRPEEMFYILLNEREGLLNCYLFRTNTANEVSDLFTQMREPSPGAATPRGSNSSLANAVTKNIGFQQVNSAEHLPWNSAGVPSAVNTNLASEPPPDLVRSLSNASALTSLCGDLSPSDSHFFEVLYIGKVRISQRKVPDSLIDDALHKFAQHEAEKALKQRRHSLLSSTGTSIYSADSTENLDKNTDSTTEKNINLNSKEPDKTTAWNNVNNAQKKETKHDNIDNEFDMFTKERVVRKSSQVPLEPNVLIVNAPTKKNLSTVEEEHERHEDVQSTISETSSSITHFCRTSLSKNDPNDIPISENNPFLDEIKYGKKVLHREDSSKTDPLMNVDVESNDSKLNVELKITEESESSKEKPLISNEKTKLHEDSPAPLSFDEIVRKPKSVSNVENRRASMPENTPFLRDRSASIGTLNLKTPITQLIGEQNRTMLFQVARSELRLISPDRKQILLHRAFKDVASCVVGRANKDHFGFVCRESTNENYACYVFKCESDSVANEVINAIKQAFIAHAELIKKSREKSPNMTCEHCPMLWYHRLCHDVEGMNEKKTHAFILRRIEQLPDDEQELIIMKYQGGTNHMYEVSEHNAFLMMLLRAHCESKQLRHVHDTAENRSEFLNQYLGSSTIFMKAKRSLSSGFDHLLKRRASRDEFQITPTVKKEPSPLPAAVPMDTSSSEQIPELLTPDANRSKSVSPIGPNGGIADPLSPAVASTAVDEESEGSIKEEPSTPLNSPMMDIFMKVSDNRPHASEPGSDPEATWRQAIYEKVVQPPDCQEELVCPKSLLHRSAPGKKTKDQLRQLWRLAIDQTILLVRMEKENDRLKESEESSAVRRIKLEYTELGVCDTGVSQMWDSLLSRDASQPMAKVDRHMLTQAVRQGVPRMSRGGVWYFLAEQYCLRSAPPDVKSFPYYHAPYKNLLSGLTKHQHAILIDLGSGHTVCCLFDNDKIIHVIVTISEKNRKNYLIKDTDQRLGRTFPKHSYFASALGPGQLALYNILKAYSMLDPDVGYCQGLSFVAGVLLLHMEEAEAFVLLRHLMFRRGLRKQYLPDMSALQVQLYQLSRLLRDHEPELHAKLEALDISPALYAAPWMLTLFTSQFPLGFVVRVFDLIFLESLDVVFAVSLALLSAHRDGLMMCESCEEAAEYLKHKLPDMGGVMFERVMRKVQSLDISRQLSEYAVEYAVLREEMPRMATLTEDNRNLLADKNRMSDELDSAMDAITNYQKTQSRLETQNKIMEQQLTLLCRYITAHHRQDMPVEIKKIIQTYSKKLSFSSKLLKFTSNDDEEQDPKKNFKTGVSAPNLFAKISKEEVMNAVNQEKNKTAPSIENDRRHFMMKKSQSVHSGLIANNLKQYPLKVLDEKDELRRDSLRTDILAESLKELGRKNSGFFANTHEQIRQERMFEKQLKHDFDENLKKLDEKIEKSYLDDLSIFQSRKAMSLNLNVSKVDRGDSGFVTPLSPPDKDDRRDDTSSIVSHPLSDVDVDIKFDGQSTKLKQIRPIRHSGGGIESKQA